VLPLNFNHLYYFYVVSKAGSFSDAARELNVSQSSISVQIRQFESYLGHKLFNRLKKGVELTESGAVVFQFAEEVFHDVDRIWNDLEAIERQIKGSLAIGTINSFGIYALPGLLKGFTADYPEVKVSVHFGGARALADMLQSGKVDIGIINGGRRYAGLTAVPLRETKLFLVGRPDHPLGTSETVNPRELENHVFIGHAEESEIRMMMDSFFRRMSLSIEYSLESSNVATIKHMVMAGLGLSILPELAVGDEIRDGRLTRIDVQGLYMGQKMTLYYKSNRTLTPTRREFLNFIQREIGAERERGAERRGKTEKTT
jgi:LysR family carnitine catabolism transcriptional activator